MRRSVKQGSGVSRDYKIIAAGSALSPVLVDSSVHHHHLMMTRLSVAVIGAGAGGLCAARHLVDQPDTFIFKVFEQTGRVGGTWVYTDETNTDQHGLPIHSSMYRDLRTNLPKEVMGFLDFPFHPTDQSFVHHSDVLKYLENYCNYYKLGEHIEFHVQVKSVSPLRLMEDKIVWKVVVENVKTKKEATYDFDAIIVCNGHYSVPHIPDIPGVETFNGTKLHSHSYREPDRFTGLNVVLLGASSSGVDISLELAQHARQVFLSHHLAEPISCELPSNLKQVPEICSASEDTLTFLDGSTCKADALIYCTGYEYSFPFLEDSCNLTIQDKRICPLYKHMIHTEFPSLSFIGIPFVVVPFPMFDLQVQYFLKTLDKTITLPSREDMNAETENDFQERLAKKMPPRYAHKLADSQWEYFEDLINGMALQPIPSLSLQGEHGKEPGG
uniref:Flavin-containing monooxygenase n=1 Tax=Timema douglasi TaxID=61478 RepID=A0A7R8VKN0_TIMDO|nr:unnamed protein product [Timema douglasi]